MLNLSRRSALLQGTRLGASVLAVSRLAIHSNQAFATNLMDQAQAQKLLHPEANSFTERPILIDINTLATLAKLTDTRVPQGFSPACSQASVNGKILGWVLFDRVIGKVDWIDYAAGFKLDGSASGVEIMAYRESHGGEIRNKHWRQQFVGRQGPKQLRFGDDIKNISGATLSCQHVSEGIQRLSALVKLSFNI